MAAVATIHCAPSAGPEPVAVTVGVPMPRGTVAEDAAFVGRPVGGGPDFRVQGRCLALWPDRSIQWLLVSALVPPDLAVAGATIELHPAALPAAGVTGCCTGLQIDASATDGRIEVSTGRTRFTFAARGDGWLDVPGIGCAAAGSPRRVRLTSRAGEGGSGHARLDALCVEEAGPVRVVLVQRGHFPDARPLEIVARWTVVRDSASVLLELRIRNPRPAQHPGGQWDLGDPGSVAIGDLSVEIDPGAGSESIEWREGPGRPLQRHPLQDWTLYQDSSGGERWDSPNHADADGRPGVAFRGYAIRMPSAGSAPPAPCGYRAQPTACIVGAVGRTAVCLQDFWQNFPKALRVRDGRLSVGLFPAERVRPSELQGGEQKRHRIAIGFGADAIAQVEALVAPVHAWVDPAAVEASAAVAGLVRDLEDDLAWSAHVRTVVDGPGAFSERREAVDEYGWRHFGDLWADHEAVFHTGGDPFVSHYNNQYDFVRAAGVHALRTGDARWARLAREAAEHTADIDVYHTAGDRPAFNGGLFWHTDHHRPARTSTHRTYSRANAGSEDYGGGPSTEHCYTGGLLLHHFRTGDPDAREAVISQADWVIAADDGRLTLLGVIDAGPTGLASFTLDPDYHGPGRGAGNAIAALLDGYAATRARRYLAKADELLQRCIHPRDDIGARRLDDPEHRWSYLVFLQVLGMYLALKEELDERGYLFHYARHSLLHYADWMLVNERPYSELFHKLALPTETWPAHDLRKCHVMHLAARYDDRGRSDAFREAAALYHDRALADLAPFPTRHLTRPLVILAAYGHLHAYHRSLAPHSAQTLAGWRHAHDFGAPVVFLRQRDRVGATLLGRAAVVRGEVVRMLRERVARWRAGRRAAPAGGGGGGGAA